MDINKLPEGEVIVVNGLPKGGKTTMAASWPDNLIIEVERSGAKWVRGAYVVEPKNTKDVDQTIKLLKVDTRFKCITLDTVDSLSLWIEKDICKKYKVSCISLAGGGYGIGRNELNTRLINIIDDLIELSKTLILITHCRDDKGSKALLLTETLYTYIQGKASIIGYAYKDIKGSKMEYLIDWGGKGTAVSGSRHPKFARAGITPNNFSAIKELFAPKPKKWDDMLKWYRKRGIDTNDYTQYICDKYEEEVHLDSLTPDEVNELLSLGGQHTKNEELFNAFQKKYASNKE